MKKMLIALCAVVMAALTQAASINWTASNPGANFDALDLCVVVKGGVRDASAWDTIANVAMGNTVVGSSLQAMDYETQANVSGLPPYGNTPSGTLNILGDLSKGDTYYIVVFNAAKKDYAGLRIDGTELKDLWYEPGSKPGATFKGTFETGTLGSVPEPTALALLALGIAGLALRRRA